MPIEVVVEVEPVSFSRVGEMLTKNADEDANKMKSLIMLLVGIAVLVRRRS